MVTKRTLGKKGEDLAVAYLEAHQYTILARNFYAKHAEVDIVCEASPAAGESPGDLVFVEVKMRTSDAYGDPIESISPTKLGLVRRAAEIYLHENEIEERFCRIDVIGISSNGGAAEVVHLKDVTGY